MTREALHHVELRRGERIVCKRTQPNFHLRRLMKFLGLYAEISKSYIPVVQTMTHQSDPAHHYSYYCLHAVNPDRSSENLTSAAEHKHPGNEQSTTRFHSQVPMYSAEKQNPGKRFDIHYNTTMKYGLRP
mmetsp:Transcript_56739/g.149487  ORF Transcript_56739/g.149487 Transcript_56739/m.149487 type:complete len:130 (-) Transcript_56739:146-535(-)